MIKVDLDKNLEKIIISSFKKGFNEIILQPDKEILFLNFKNGNLYSIPFTDLKIKINDNLILKYTENIIGIDNMDKANFVKTFRILNYDFLIRVYSFYNKGKRNIDIKILNYKINNLSDYVNGIQNFDKKQKKDFYLNLLKTDLNRGSITIVASQTENTRKNFFYSIINEINKTKTSKIVSYENTIENLVIDNKSLVFQSKYIEDDSKEYVRFLNPDYIFFHNTVDKKILIEALSLANSGKKVYISTKSTDFDKNKKNFIKYLEQEILGYEVFEEYFLNFITLSNFNGNTFIYKVQDGI